MRSFFIITNKQKDKDLQVTHDIELYLDQHNGIYKTQITNDCGGGDSYTNVDDIPADTECILVLGGDGTLLRAANDTLERNIPLIGVNLGRLGYLAEVEQSNIEGALEAILADEYEIANRMMLDGSIIREGKQIEKFQALNDIIISRFGSLSILNFNIYVNDLFLKAYHADGIIIATPTGSTGYNMSAGGPIVEPKAKLMLLTPICPHTFNTRSIILAPEDIITVEIALGREGMNQDIEVSFDGSHKVKLMTGDRIQITQASKKTKILKLNKVSFLEVLHKKMSES